MKSRKVKLQKEYNLRKPFKYEVDIYWSVEDSAFIAVVPELPGCMTHGETRIEAAKMADEAIEAYLEALVETGQEIPTPLAEEEFSGEFLVRTGDPALHRRLTMLARAERKKLTPWLVQKLRELK
jgi:predicted RNase H-like HicB family nuclease